LKKTIVLIRHAKSSWSDPSQSDFDRPLNERGEHDAPMMGERLRKWRLLPDIIVCSSARRTRQTAKRIAAAIGFDKDAIRREENLYHCTPDTIASVIRSLDDAVTIAFIVAHNPGITDFVNQLSDMFRIDNMPTCGIVAATLQTAHWADFSQAEKEVFLFEYPKKVS